MLNQALHEETGLVRFYESILRQCDYPEVRKLFEELAEERSRTAIRILQKLNELHARAETQDDVMSSFGEVQ
jgi:rubrerythrin